MDHQKTLEQLFNHDVEMRKLEAQLLEDKDSTELERVLTAATDTATGRSDDEGLAQLELIAGLWGQMASPRAASTLFDLLGHPSEEVRQVSGGALIDLAASSFDDFAEAFHALVKRPGDGTEATFELPFLIAHIEDPKIVDLVLALLAHADPQVVAASLEVAGESGWDERVRDAIEALCDDSRVATIIGEDEKEENVAIGDLATTLTNPLRALWQEKQ